MRVLPLLITWAVAASAAGCAGPMLARTPQQGTVNPRAAAMAAFQERVGAYLELHMQVAGGLPPLVETSEPVQITAREKALGEAIRRARAGAQPGDVFGRELRPLFEEILREDWRERTRRSRKAIVAQVPQRSPLEVNDAYPETQLLATVPPVLLQRLPRLPEGLEYRLFARHLILRDVKANLVVDILRDVLPGGDT